jgi:hypothetical protein
MATALTALFFIGLLGIFISNGLLQLRTRRILLGFYRVKPEQAHSELGAYSDLWFNARRQFTFRKKIARLQWSAAREDQALKQDFDRLLLRQRNHVLLVIAVFVIFILSLALKIMRS